MHVLKYLDATTTGSQPAINDKGSHGRCILDLVTDGRKRLGETLDLPMEKLMTDDPIKERMCLLGHVVLLQVSL